MHFVDYSSAFNTVIPGKHLTKLLKLQVPLLTCTWIKMLHQAVQSNICQTRPSPLLHAHFQRWFSSRLHSEPSAVRLYTYECSPTHPTNYIIKYTDGTALTRLEVMRVRRCTRQRWIKCCSGAQKTTWPWMSRKTKELNMEFRINRKDRSPSNINGARVETVPYNSGYPYLCWKLLVL